MDTQNTKYLKNKYPFVGCSISCGDGWFILIDSLLGDIATLGVKGLQIISISQKFGYLRVLFRASVEEDFDRIRELIWAAQEKSVKTCEGCGNPGRLRDEVNDEEGRCRTLCDKCSSLSNLIMEIIGSI